MKDRIIPSGAGQPSWVPGVFSLGLPLEVETRRFVLVSALDLFMTCLLLQQPQFTEANPVALYVLNRWGLAGMAWFKLGMVTFVALLAQAIARHKHLTARRVLDFATISGAAAVIYSLALLLLAGS